MKVLKLNDEAKFVGSWWWVGPNKMSTHVLDIDIYKKEKYTLLHRKKLYLLGMQHTVKLFQTHI